MQLKALTKYALLMAAFLLFLAWLLGTRKPEDRKAAFDLLIIGAVCSVLVAAVYEVQW